MRGVVIFEMTKFQHSRRRRKTVPILGPIQQQLLWQSIRSQSSRVEPIGST